MNQDQKSGQFGEEVLELELNEQHEQLQQCGVKFEKHVSKRINKFGSRL